MVEYLSNCTSWVYSVGNVKSRRLLWLDLKAGLRKLWSVVEIICLEKHMSLGMGLVRDWRWGCDNHRELLETSDMLVTSQS